MINVATGSGSGAGGSVGGNFMSFVYTEAGRRVVNEDGADLSKIGWQIALSHNDRMNVSARFCDQEDRSVVQVHPEYRRRLEEAKKDRDEMAAKISTPEGQAAWAKRRREEMTAAEARFARIAEDQLRRMQTFIDDLENWKAPAPLAALKADLISDARNWRPSMPSSPLPAWAETDDGIIAHDIASRNGMADVLASDLRREEQTVARLNEWLAAMRQTFGPEPEGYWDERPSVRGGTSS